MDKKMLASLLAFGGGGGITPSGTLSIASNGTYDVGAFAEASVLVPASAVVSGTKQISVNGTHDVTAFANAEVLVPASAVVSGTKQISANGTHDVTAFASAQVLVPASAVDVGTKSISENGTHDVVGFANVDVNIPVAGNEDAIIEHALSGAYINSRVTYIGEETFLGCSRLTEVSFPQCKTIAYGAFYGCSRLSVVSFPNVSRVESNIFAGCSLLSIVSFPSLTSLNSGAFRGNVYIRSVFLPQMSKLQYAEFSSCAVLTAIYLSAINSFGATATTNAPFYKCANVRSLYLLTSSVPYLASPNYLFPSATYASVFVPTSLYSDYINATNWAALSSRIVSLTDEQIAEL